MALANGRHGKGDEGQNTSDYDKVHTGPNESIPDPEAGGNHLTPDELDFTGDHASHEAKVSQAGQKAADEAESDK